MNSFNIAVVGAGYVGLVTAACLAELIHHEPGVETRYIGIGR